MLELGRKIVEELEERDITAKWMAAHLADLMIQAKSDPSKIEPCSEMILTLWRQRRIFPGGDPLGRYTKILAAIEKQLGVGSTSPLFEYVYSSGFDESQGNDWASLANRILRRADLVALAAIDEANEVEGLRKDELLQAADLSDADDQTNALIVFRTVGVDADGNRVFEKEPELVTKAITDLRVALDEFETAYSQKPKKKPH